MKKLALVLVLIAIAAASSSASPCPTSATLDVFIGLGSAGCDVNSGHIFGVTFESQTLLSTDVSVTPISFGGHPILAFSFDSPVTLSDFVIRWTTPYYSNGAGIDFVGAGSIVDINGPVVYGAGFYNVVNGYPSYNFGSSISPGDLRVISVGDVPEPSSLLLLGTGVSSLSLLRFRRKV